MVYLIQLDYKIQGLISLSGLVTKPYETGNCYYSKLQVQLLRNMFRLQKSLKTDAHMIELNISCPNVKEGGVAFGVSWIVRLITSAVRKATTKPLIVKLSPNVTDIASIARAVEAGCRCNITYNTILG